VKKAPRTKHRLPLPPTCSLPALFPTPSIPPPPMQVRAADATVLPLADLLWYSGHMTAEALQGGQGEDAPLLTRYAGA
jgi:hypothetical protein